MNCDHRIGTTLEVSQIPPEILERPTKFVYAGEQTNHTIVRKGLKKEMLQAYAILDRFYIDQGRHGRSHARCIMENPPDQAAAELIHKK
jgi:ABC-type proline/glycine betaine transport system substrate-binding protein